MTVVHLSPNCCIYTCKIFPNKPLSLSFKSITTYWPTTTQFKQAPHHDFSILSPNFLQVLERSLTMILTITKVSIFSNPYQFLESQHIVVSVIWIWSPHRFTPKSPLESPTVSVIIHTKLHNIPFIHILSHITTQKFWTHYLSLVLKFWHKLKLLTYLLPVTNTWDVY